MPLKVGTAGSQSPLVAPDVAIAERIRRILAGRYLTKSNSLAVIVETGEARSVVERVRAARGGGPLGYIALDDVAAIDALTFGADEALTWSAPDDAAIHAFLDRTQLRASIRKEQEHYRTDVAHSEKLAALGTLVAGVAHEISNPLTALQLSVEAFRGFVKPILDAASELQRLSSRGTPASAAELDRLGKMMMNGATPTETEELLGEVVYAVKCIANVVRDLRVFARSDSDTEQPEPVDITQVIDQALRLVGRDITSHGHIEKDYSPDVPLLVAPPGKLTQVLINLLVNAAHAIRDIDRSYHRVRVSTRTDGEYAAVSVGDSGPGILPEDLDRIFDPFFTTKRANAGTGLGLSISRSILQELGGDLIVESVHGDGATFIAMIPLPDPDALQEAQDRQTPAPGHVYGAKRNVLLVDQDERVLRAYARTLAPTCNVLLATDGQEAIELLDSGSIADVIVTELFGPAEDGEALYRWLCDYRSDLVPKVVFVTAQTTSSRYQHFLGNLPNPVLLKPVSASALHEAIARASSSGGT